jgi:hypothetical protein
MLSGKVEAKQSSDIDKSTTIDLSLDKERESNLSLGNQGT